MEEYEINSNTLVMIPIDKDHTKVIEIDNEFVIGLSAIKIVDKSCLFFGSSYQGRILGTKEILGTSSKAPIVIEESRRIIFFPTCSPRLEECVWLSLNNIGEIKKENNNTNIIFNCGKCVCLNVSYNIIDNQILRATRLQYLLEKRMV